jgi:hypothetical protein
MQTPAQPPTQHTEQPEGWCSKHSVQMKLNHKNVRSWWSPQGSFGSLMSSVTNRRPYPPQYLIAALVYPNPIPERRQTSRVVYAAAEAQEDRYGTHHYA